MSREFDLEPPKAPAEKKEKKSFFGNLFGSKQKSSSALPAMPVPQESDVASLREKLGIGPITSPQTQDHFDTLEKQANASSLSDAEQYDKEQSEIPVEGSLDAALDEMKSSPSVEEPFLAEPTSDAVSMSEPSLDEPVEENKEPELFIDPSLVDEANNEQELEKPVVSSFDVDDFSEDSRDAVTDSKEDSTLAQPEFNQSPVEEETTSEFAQEVSTEPIKLSEPLESENSFVAEPVIDEVPAPEVPSLELPVSEVPEFVEPVEDVRIPPVEESPFVDETSQPEEKPSLEETISLEEKTIAQESESPFVQEDLEQPFTSPVEENPFDSDFSTDPISATSLLESEDVPVESDFAKDDSDLLNAFESKPDSEFTQEINSSEPNFIEEESAKEEEIFQSPDPVVEEEKIIPIIKTPKKVAKKATKKVAKKATKKATKKSSVAKKVTKKKVSKKEVEKPLRTELLSEEKKHKLLEEAKVITEKKFNTYLKKEEKITETFLRKEDVLSKYLLSEKKNFLELFSLLSLEDVKKGIVVSDADVALENVKAVDLALLLEQLRVETSKYETKLQQLYDKKYSAFSQWIEQESKLLRANLANFQADVKLKEGKLKLKQQSVNDLKKEILSKLKGKESEYKLILKKITLAEKKLAKKHSEFDSLLESQQQKTEKLVIRESEVKIKEKSLGSLQKNSEEKLAKLEKSFIAQNKILDTVLKNLKAKQSKLKDLGKEEQTLKNTILKNTQLNKEKTKEIKSLDAAIILREKKVSDKEKRLDEVEKQTKKLLDSQKKSHELLAKRESAVLEKINLNEKILRTIEMKKKALIELEERVEADGFQSYINAKLDQINPDASVLADEEHILSDSPELGSKIYTLLHSCKSNLAEKDFAQSKKIYAQIRQEYASLELPVEEKSLLYTKIRELYDDINLKMLEERNEVRSNQVM